MGHDEKNHTMTSSCTETTFFITRLTDIIIPSKKPILQARR
jgi:hypothetical protein